MFDAAFAARLIPSMLAAAEVVARVLHDDKPPLVAQLSPEMLSAAQDVRRLKGLRDV